MLGDNREKSTDSRVFGCVDISDTKGEVVSILRRRNF
ncbi:MAG: S26 family signal peptidase [Lachnospiraceae bacterium]|nr:S26 family signal peptidase [Lachnospiraceae bacterium]